MSPLLSFAQDKLQLIALGFMGVVYLIKIRWILTFPAGKDRFATTADASTNASSGAVYSLFNIAMPWAMASTRRHFFFYVQFAVFHIGVALSIIMSFLIPYAPGLIADTPVIRTMQILFAAALAAGIVRMVRRFTDPYVRSISTPDDYFSLGLLLVWFAFSILAAPNRPHEGEFPLLAYFFLTAFFLIYVPFSKISHYIYYPFSRWYLGKTLGHRGVLPVNRLRQTQV